MQERKKKTMQEDKTLESWNLRKDDTGTAAVHSIMGMSHCTRLQLVCGCTSRCRDSARQSRAVLRTDKSVLDRSKSRLGTKVMTMTMTMKTHHQFPT
jgi:hypothetical protein